MDTRDLSDMLAGNGADWSTVDTDEYGLDDLSYAERVELGLIPSPPLSRHQCREPYHPGRHDHATEFGRVRTNAIRSLRAARQLAIAAGDMMEASSIERDMAAYLMMEEADLLIADLKNPAF
jgi:hypothetical protein